MSDHPPVDLGTTEIGEDAQFGLAIAAFDRLDDEILRAHGLAPGALPVVRRLGGGSAVQVGPGIVRVAFRFPMDGRIAPDAERIVNRAVRPILRALRRCTPLAHYFGRDVVSVKVAGQRRDVGVVGFGHDATAGTAVLEVFLALTAKPRPDLVPLADLVPGLTAAALCERLAHELAAEGVSCSPLVPLAAVDADAEPSWEVVAHTPFARVGASADPPRIGGDFFVSSDWLRQLHARLDALPAGSSTTAIEASFDEGLRDGQVLVGVAQPRDLAAPLLEALSRR
jgi:hypothetical protein